MGSGWERSGAEEQEQDLSARRLRQIRWVRNTRWLSLFIGAGLALGLAGGRMWGAVAAGASAVLLWGFWPWLLFPNQMRSDPVFREAVIPKRKGSKRP